MISVRKKLFFRRFLHYFALMLLPVFLTMSIVVFFSQKTQTEQAESQIVQSLRSIEEMVDISLKNTVFLRDAFVSMPRMMIYAQNYLSTGVTDYEEIQLVYNLQTLISTAAYTNSNIHSIYLYWDGIETVYTSNTGLQSANTMKDTTWKPIYESEHSTSKIRTQRRPFGSTTSSESLISVFLPLITSRGVIVVNMYPEKIEEYMQNNVSDMQEAYYLLNPNDEIIACSEPFDIASGTLAQVTSLNNQLDYIPSQVNIDNRSFYLTTTPYGLYGYRLISLVSKNEFHALSTLLLHTLLLESLVAIMVAVASALIVTRKNIRQIYYLMDIVSTSEKDNLSAHKSPSYVMDEYEFISSNIIKTYIINENLRQEVQLKEYMKTKIELIALQLQINPHFLFNSLQLLDSQVYQLSGKHSTLNTTIQTLSGILHYATRSPNKPVTIEDELSQLESYAYVNKQRYPTMFQLYFDYEDCVLSYYVFRLMLQPLIENSIEHGIRPLNEKRKGLVKVRIHTSSGRIRFSIIDNGVGMTTEQILALRETINNNEISDTHIGISNTNNRLILCFGPDSKLNIRSRLGRGTSISFSIPAIDKAENLTIRYYK